MTSKIGRSVAASLAAVSSAFVAAPAFADDTAAAEADALTEVVVTARKFQEGAQSLPITIAAFTGEELSNKAVLNVQDLQAITPGLTISANSRGGIPIFAIRGTSTEIGVDGGVALYFNDAPLISSVGMMNSFYDVSTVEVLKGPQGTQFGTNTTGGTLTVRTNLPTDKLEGYVKGGYGNFSRLEGEGLINIPVSDVVGLRFAGNYVKRDGYVNNPIHGGVLPGDYSDEDHYSFRGTASYNSGPVKSVLILDYFNRNEAPSAQIPIAFGPSALGIDLARLGAQLGSRDTIFVGPNLSGVNPRLFGKAELYGVQHRLNIDLSNHLELRNVLSYRHDDTTSSEENSGTTITTVNVLNNTKTGQWTDDLTLRYTGIDGRLRAAVGGYYSSLSQTQGINANVVQGVYLTFFGLPLDTDIRNFEKRNTKSKAVYVNSDFDVTGTLTVSAGVRYNWDNAKSRVSATQVDGVLPNFGYNFLPDASNPCSAGALAGYADKDLVQCIGRRSAEFQAGSYNFVVSNKFSPELLGYAKVSHGYLAGGTNFTIREVPFYNPEKTTMYEAGVKADWSLGGRPIRTNLAIYKGVTTDKQVNYNANYDDGFSGYGVFNAAKEQVYGADFEVRYSPFHGFTLDASYNYIDAKFKKFRFPAVGGNADGLTGVTLVPAVDLTNAKPAQTPTQQVNLSATYKWPLNSSVGDVSSTISGYYTSTTAQTNVFPPYNALFGDQYNTLPSYFIANASLNWESVLGSPLSAQVWVRNLFDRDYLTFRGTQFQAFGYATVMFGASRTFGVSANYRF